MFFLRRTRAIILLFRQLSILLRSGMPLLKLSVHWRIFPSQQCGAGWE